MAHGVLCTLTLACSDVEEFEVKRYWVDCLRDNKVHWRDKSSKGRPYRTKRTKNFFGFCFVLGGIAVSIKRSAGYCDIWCRLSFRVSNLNGMRRHLARTLQATSYFTGTRSLGEGKIWGWNRSHNLHSKVQPNWRGSRSDAAWLWPLSIVLPAESVAGHYYDCTWLCNDRKVRAWRGRGVGGRAAATTTYSKAELVPGTCTALDFRRSLSPRMIVKHIHNLTKLNFNDFILLIINLLNCWLSSHA